MKYIFILMLCASAVISAPAATLEKWDFTGADGSGISTAPSTLGSVSLIDAGVFELQDNTLSITYAGKANSWGGTAVPSMGSGLSTGIYQMQWTVISSDFANTFAAGTKAQFGFGFEDQGGGTPECLAMFGFNGTAFELSAVGIPDIPATTISSAGVSQIDGVTVRLVLDLDNKGAPGSAKIYYTAGATEQMLSGTLPAAFSIDSIYQRVHSTASGNSWKAGDVTYVDNLYLSSGDELIFIQELAFVQENISFIQKNGMILDKYEPGDVLQIVTTNRNDTVIAVSDVTTSLSADPSAFRITPSSHFFQSLDAGEVYTGTYQVEILDGATDGSNTFTVINRIGSGVASMAFPASF